MKILEIINNNLNIKKYLVILVMIIVIKKVRKITMKRRLFKILAILIMLASVQSCTLLMLAAMVGGKEMAGAVGPTERERQPYCTYNYTAGQYLCH